MFYISVSNGLLESDHYEKMGQAVWLFMWLIDKITKVDGEGWGLVLGGKPINLNDVPFLTERTMRRYLAELRRYDYIKTTRTPYGMVVKVRKAKKKFGREVPKLDEPDRPKSVMGVATNGLSLTKNGRSNKTLQLDKTKDMVKSPTSRGVKFKQMKKNSFGGYREDQSADSYDDAIDIETGERLKPKAKEKSKAQLVFALFPSPQKSWLINATERLAAENLYEEKGIDKIQHALAFFKAHKDEKYCPQVGSPYALYTKWRRLAEYKTKSQEV